MAAQLQAAPENSEPPKAAPKRLRVYVAGAYSATNVIGVFGNMRRGIALAREVLRCGFYPYVPWCDFPLHLLGEVPLSTAYSWSMSFLEVCDAVLVVPEGAESSKGTQAEIRRAQELGIPVFIHIGDLCEWFHHYDDA